MQDTIAFDIKYREHLWQTAWVNEHGWLFARPARKRPVRRIVAEALRALACIAAPTRHPTRPATMP
jgi:hypothetical protein